MASHAHNSSIPSANPASSTSEPRQLRRLTVLISGSGTNLAALITACNNGELPNTKIVRVISNRKNAYGLTRAQEAGIPTYVWTLADFRKKHAAIQSPEPEQRRSLSITEREAVQTREGGPEEESQQNKDRREARLRSAYDAGLAEIVLNDKPDLIVLAGFMHILSPTFLARLREQPSPSQLHTPIINLHPALPHQFNGANAIRRAHEAFGKGLIEKTGIMCHYVIEEVDEGEVICTREIEMKKGESLEDLEGRIHVEEWKIIVDGTRRALKRLESGV